MERQRGRSGKDRSAAYRARLAARAEPPRWRVADEFMLAVVEASQRGDTGAAAIVALVADRVTQGDRFSREGVDNVLARVVADLGRRA